MICLRTQPQWPVLLAIAGVLLGGCAGQSATSTSSERRSHGDQSGSLIQLAAAERDRAGRSKVVEVPLPPGIEPGALSIREPGNERATLSLDQVIERFAAQREKSTEQPLPTTEPDSSEERSAEALKAYAKGRAAALDNRHLQAVVEYQKALAIDPESPEVLREIARSYDASGNQQRAYEMLERLIRVAPDDLDALYALGVAAATRREFEKSAEYLVSLLRTVGDARSRAAVNVIVEYTLAISLRELGYDQAYIELAGRVVDMPAELAAGSPSSRLASVYRQRGELLRSVGDAHARLEQYVSAIDAWLAASQLPSADPSSLHPRIIYAHLRLGRPYNAQLVLLESLQMSASLGPVSDRDVLLCAYVAQNAKPVDRLAVEVRSLQRAHPDDGGCVRAAAMLVPQEQAIELLRGFLERRPDDVQALAQLLSWLLSDDPGAASRLTVSLVADQPSRADRYSDVFGQVSQGYANAIRAVESLPDSAAKAVVLTRLYLRSGAHGRAWSACSEALKRWPDDVALRLRAVEIAAAMQEPALVNRAIAACADINDVSGLITLSQARRALRQTSDAIDFAKRAVDVDAESAAAHVELARAHHAHAVILASDPNNAAAARENTLAAIAAANKAVALAPTSDDPYETLALIYGPGGALADSQEFRNLLLLLRQNNPQSPLYNRLAAQDALSQRRFDQALERLISAYDGNPADTTALQLAVATWERSEELDEAEAWLRNKLNQRPGDAALREQLLRVQVLQRQGESAVEEFERQLQADPDDWTALRLLEAAYRLIGQTREANSITERRLLERPDGVRREIELAALYVNDNRLAEALARLDRVRELAMDATDEDLNAAMAIVNGVVGHDDRRDAIALDLAFTVIERTPRSPLQTYGNALRAIARQQQRSGSTDDRFEPLVREAIAHAPGAGDTSLAGARLWQELAQALLVDNLPAAAAHALRIRLNAEPAFDKPAHAAISRIVLVVDAETAYQNGPDDADAAEPVVARTIETLESLEDQVLLQMVFGTQAPIALPDALYEASVIFTLVGAEAGSEALMRYSLSERPEDAMILNNLGYMLLERGARTEELERLINQAGQLQPTESNILDTVGWLRYKQGRLTDDEAAQALDAADPRAGAVTLIQKAIDSSSDPSPEVFDHLGDAKWRLGDQAGAIEAWKRAVSMLDDGEFRRRLIQNVAALQAQQWGIIVMAGERMYEREYAPVLERAQLKIAAAARGEEPPVAPQW